MNDDGFTFLPGHLRVRKSDPRISALGALDELNGALGLLRAALPGRPEADRLETRQREIMAICGEMATGQPALPPDALAALDAETTTLQAARPPAHGFVVPGAGELSARAHLARVVARRAERELVAAGDLHPGFAPPAALAYLNHLSIWLFALARTLE